MTTTTMAATTPLTLQPRPVAASLDELLSGVTEREPLASDDGKSAVPMERVVIGGERYVVKHLHVDDDWISRAFGDVGCKPIAVWRSGLLDAMPACIDHAVVGAAVGLGRNGWGGALLMRDVGEWLVPPGDDVVPLEQHASFIENMATMHATFAGFVDTIGLTPPTHRWLPFCDEMVAYELSRPDVAAVPRIVGDGWSRFERRAPARVAAAITELRADVGPLVGALWQLPLTFVHGDWKMGNLGTKPDGTTVLLDWQAPGCAPGAADLCWYLAINAARLPESKESAINRYREALEARDVATAGWFDRQVALCNLGTVVQFGWEKALGGDAEWQWWIDRAVEGLELL